MPVLAKILVGVIAAEHLFILWVEMFAWTTVGKRLFTSLDSELFHKTKAMAANQGLYNGFLSAGLIWSILIKDPRWAFYIAVFFLGCVVVAGTYGAVTSARTILYKQALPAFCVLILLILVIQ